MSELKNYSTINNRQNVSRQAGFLRDRIQPQPGHSRGIRMIRIAVVEDEKDCQEQLGRYIKQYGKETGQLFDVTVFSDGLDIVENYNPIWDIIFMDIRMKHMDGMKAAGKIREYDPAVIIIFITTMGQYAIKGYEVDALDFVLKPVSYAQFSMKMRKAAALIRKTEEKYLLLPVEDRKERVSTRDILFLEVQNHNLQVVTRNKIYVMRHSMQAAEKDLADCHFVRCNNSYLVNLANVTGVNKDTVTVEKYELPISRPRKKQFLKALSDYLGAGYR